MVSKRVDFHSFEWKSGAYLGMQGEHRAVELIIPCEVDLPDEKTYRLLFEKETSEKDSVNDEWMSPVLFSQNGEIRYELDQRTTSKGKVKMMLEGYEGNKRIYKSPVVKLRFDHPINYKEPTVEEANSYRAEITNLTAQTNKAVAESQNATQSALDAAQKAQTSSLNADTAAENAQQATKQAQQESKHALDAAIRAESSSKNASLTAEQAKGAAIKAEKAAEQAEIAVKNAENIIEIIPANMFDDSTCTEEFFDLNNKDSTTSYNGYLCSDYMKVYPKIIYIVKLRRAMLYDKNKAYIGYKQFEEARWNTTTFAENVAFIRADVGKNINPHGIGVYNGKWEIPKAESYAILNPQLFNKALRDYKITEDNPFKNDFDEFRWNIVDNDRIMPYTKIDPSTGEIKYSFPGHTTVLTTELCPVFPGVTYYTGALSPYAYDKNKKFVGRLQHDNGKVTIPENIKYLRTYKEVLSSEYEAGTANTYSAIYDTRYGYKGGFVYDKHRGFPVFKDEESKRGFQTYLGIFGPWANKQVATLGDSFSEPGGWQKSMAEILNCSIINVAKSGAGFYQVDNVSGVKSIYQQAVELFERGASPDMILIFVGVNDFNNVRPLGDFVKSANIQDFDVYTVTGGIQCALTYLQNKFPMSKIKVGFTPAGYAYINDFADEYINNLKRVASRYGVEYIDVTTCGITKYSTAYADCFEGGTGGGHPTEKGQELIGKAIAKKLNNL